MTPSVFVTAAHHHAGLKRDAASVWVEDVTQSSFKVCLRELQNYAGSHEDVYVVRIKTFLLHALYISTEVHLCFCFVLFFSFCSIVTLPVCFFVFVFIEWLYFSKTSYRSMSRTSIDQRKTYGKEKRRKENHKNKETITFSYVFRPFIDDDFLLFSYFRNGWHSHLSTNLYSLTTVQFILLIPSRHLLVTTELITRYS